jgi:hypothetical protein
LRHDRELLGIAVEVRDVELIELLRAGAWIEIGTFWRFSERFCAVTMITLPPSAGCGAAWGAASCAIAMLAGARSAVLVISRKRGRPAEAIRMLNPPCCISCAQGVRCDMIARQAVTSAANRSQMSVALLQRIAAVRQTVRCCGYVEHRAERGLERIEPGLEGFHPGALAEDRLAHLSELGDGALGLVEGQAGLFERQAQAASSARTCASVSSTMRS